MIAMTVKGSEMSFEIEKVIIRGEMPEGCIWCDYHDGDYYSCQPNHWCGIKRGSLRRIADANTRPEWCPLVTTDWVLNELHSPFRNWNWDEDLPQAESEDA